MTDSVENAVYRDVSYISPHVEVDQINGELILMRCAEPLADHAEVAGEWLIKNAKEAPDRTYIVEQTRDGERSITYGDALKKMLLLAEGLMRFELDETRPILVMANNGIPHALLMLASFHIGVPITPVAPAYALQSTDYVKLQGVVDLITPGLVVVEDGERYAPALNHLTNVSASLVAIDNPSDDMSDFSNLFGDGSQEEAVKSAAAMVTPDTIAKFLFTSGSTAAPKAVINTHRMLCVNAQMQDQVTPSITEQAPVMVNWLPWNHTAGGNNVFNMILSNGGTLYIDPGKPVPGAMDKSLELLRRVSPNPYFNVPMGFEALIPHLEKDKQLRESFFGDVQLLWYAAASMQASTWEALDRLAYETIGKKILIISGMGMTETAPCALFGNKVANGPGVVGVPVPGLELKLVDMGFDQWEVRYKGPNVTPGYWRDEEATKKSLDDDGYFLSGDLLSFVDQDDPERGLVYEGRISDDFKLNSGTRVAAGSLRMHVLDMLPREFVQDVAIMGDGRAEIRIFIFPNWEACCDELGLSHDIPAQQLALNSKIQTLFKPALKSIYDTGTGGSNRVVAALLAAEPPSESLGEVTQKGTINRRILQRNRQDLIEKLYRKDEGVIQAS